MTAADDKPLTEFLANMNLEPGASVQEITALEEKMGLSLPESYKTLLRFANGAVGPIGPEYLQLYDIDYVLDVNARLHSWLEGLLIFGGDGGGEAYVFDPADDWSIEMMPWIPMGREELVPLGRTLHEFFTILQNNQRLGRI